MIIDSAAFTPVSAALGGLMIGIAVAVLLLFNGRIAGISGIFANMFTKQSGWRIAFIAGAGRGTVGLQVVCRSAGCGDRCGLSAADCGRSAGRFRHAAG